MPATSEQMQQTETAMHAGDAVDQYLTFMLASEEYGVEILRVQEIKGWEQATPMPNTPRHVMGVINIRGEIVPIIDLRQRFGLESIPRSPTTVVIVVKAIAEDQHRTVGLMVDAVLDVHRLEQEQTQSTPDLGDGISADCISGLATIGDKMVLLIDVDKLVDFSAIRHASMSAPE